MVAPPPAPGSDIGLPDSLRSRPQPGEPAEPALGPAPDWTRDPLGEPMSGGDRKRFFAWTRRRQTVSSDAEAPLSETAPPPFERPEPPPRRPVPPPLAPSRPEPPRPEPPRAAAPQPEPPAEEAPAEVTVLKSGVIDGMGYTLYTDGSIDAAFEHGTLRFDSIDDLRRHLEQSNG
ncbi:hypothetical protein CH341_29735 [Rhodoplanes roseus]|uniref:DUF308 domain-containing protein n=1 Tax=Rhodoplanes roseus TaxID=29409 RepID=A0A327KGN6_9BRAD|nr:hypothetical protein CH341_29735 [Rhodoplanes roseus]